MKKSVVLKKEIDAKRVEVENFQREEKIPEAKKAAAELSKMVDEYDVTVAMERSCFENFLGWIHVENLHHLRLPYQFCS